MVQKHNKLACEVNMHLRQWTHKMLVTKDVSPTGNLACCKRNPYLFQPTNIVYNMKFERMKGEGKNPFLFLGALKSLMTKQFTPFLVLEIRFQVMILISVYLERVIMVVVCWLTSYHPWQTLFPLKNNGLSATIQSHPAYRFEYSRSKKS